MYKIAYGVELICHNKENSAKRYERELQNVFLISMRSTHNLKQILQQGLM